MDILQDSKRAENIREQSGFLSRWFFWYLNGLFKVGYKRQLNDQDVFNMSKDYSAHALSKKLERIWENELSKKGSGRDGELPSFSWCIVKLGISLFGGTSILLLIASFAKLAQCYALRFLVESLSEKDSDMGYLWASVLCLSIILVWLLHHRYFFLSEQYGAGIRAAATSLIYMKTLKLSNGSLNQLSTGHVVTLISSDVRKLQEICKFINFLWISPIVFVATVVILWNDFGTSSLSGVATLTVSIIMQSYLGKYFAYMRRKTVLNTDKRVSTMNEMVSSIQVIKMYSWEKSFAAAIHAIRKKETRCIMKASAVRAVNFAMFSTTHHLVLLAIIGTFYLRGGNVSLPLVFQTLGLMFSIRFEVMHILPLAIQMAMEARVALKRIQKYLLHEEMKYDQQSKYAISSGSSAEVKFENVSAAWDEVLQKPVFHNISFCCNTTNNLAMIIGPIGSGKSSILMAALKELKILNGEVKVNGSVAYSAQQPWIFSGTLRQNILFGKEYNEEIYNKVITACTLTSDIKLFQDGDMTLVGEKGVALSGGQKARISLARAVYHDADIYLLDDPLSAVDAKVGKQIFEGCIQGLLKNKVVILVTHQIQYLKYATDIICLENGEACEGTFNDFLKKGVDLESILGTEEDNLQSQQKQHNDQGHKHLNADDLEATSTHGSYLNPGVLMEECLSTSMTSSTGGLEENDDSADLSKFMSEDDEEDINQSSSNHSNHTGCIPITASYTNYGVMTEEDDDRRDKNEEKEKDEEVKELSTVLNGKVHQQGLDDIPMKQLDHNKKEQNTPEKTLTKETTTRKRKGMKLYYEYMWKGLGWFPCIVLIIAFLGGQMAFTFADIYLAEWIKGEDQTKLGLNTTSAFYIKKHPSWNLYIYAGIVIFNVLISIFRTLFCYICLIKCSQYLHNKMLRAVVKAPLYFFDTNPIGQILNRFSRDIILMDEDLPWIFFDFCNLSFLSLSIIILNCISVPYLLILFVPLFGLFVYFRNYYLCTAKQVKQLEAKARSPLYTHVSATLAGLSTIRSFSHCGKVLEELLGCIDFQIEAWVLFLETCRWFGQRIDFFAVVFNIFAIFGPVVAVRYADVDPGIAGVGLTYTLVLCGMFQFCVRQSAEVDNLMISTERVYEYSKLKPEPDQGRSENLSKQWPEKGLICAQNASFAYHSTLPNVLKGLNFTIQPREKVGIVGRTGAGKSSLLNMLFRLGVNTGVVKIDDRDISELKLEDLRNVLSVIPQDPVLFAGTLRKNLDPFSEYNDEDIWESLEKVQLKKLVAGFTNKLETEITESGSNLSVGERQLFCLARALLKKNKVLVIDEATANVDFETDALIQSTIREKFEDCTVLTIAHRLNTIMDSNRIMVLDAGDIVEFDAPYKLLQIKSGILRKLVDQTGEEEAARLEMQAKNALELNRNRETENN